MLLTRFACLLARLRSSLTANRQVFSGFLLALGSRSSLVAVAGKEVRERHGEKGRKKEEGGEKKGSLIIINNLFSHSHYKLKMIIVN